MLAWEMVDVQFSITNTRSLYYHSFFKKVLVLHVYFFKVFFFNNKEEKMFEKGYILDA